MQHPRTPPHALRILAMRLQHRRIRFRLPKNIPHHRQLAYHQLTQELLLLNHSSIGRGPVGL